MKKNGQLDRQEVIRVLSSIRKEWEEAAEGESLDQVYGSVGLLLDDIEHGIGIKQEPEPLEVK